MSRAVRIPGLPAAGLILISLLLAGCARYDYVRAPTPATFGLFVGDDAVQRRAAFSDGSYYAAFHARPTCRYFGQLQETRPTATFRMFSNSGSEARQVTFLGNRQQLRGFKVFDLNQSRSWIVHCKRRPELGESSEWIQFGDSEPRLRFIEGPASDPATSQLVDSLPYACDAVARQAARQTVSFGIASVYVGSARSAYCEGGLNSPPSSEVDAHSRGRSPIDASTSVDVCQMGSCVAVERLVSVGSRRLMDVVEVRLSLAGVGVRARSDLRYAPPTDWDPWQSFALVGPVCVALSTESDETHEFTCREVGDSRTLHVHRDDQGRWSESIQGERGGRQLASGEAD